MSPRRLNAPSHQLDGDDSFQRRASFKVRCHNPEGDLPFIDGKIVRKFEGGDDGWVD